MMRKGTVFIISAPSGAGKTSLVRALVSALPNVIVSVSYTTRAARPQEKDGIDYHFVDPHAFQTMLNKNDFLEHAQVFGHFYGTSRTWVEERLEQGFDVILEIDWQGARQVRTQILETESIFILPPSREALSERLVNRHSDNSEVIQARLNDAKNEISRYNEYDYLVCNDRFEDALEDIQSIIRSNRLRWRSQAVQQAALINNLLS